MKTYLELDLEVDYTFTKGYPAYLSGLPEDCYPEEPDRIEINSVTLNGNEIADMLTPAQLDELAEIAMQNENDRLADEGPE